MVRNNKAALRWLWSCLKPSLTRTQHMPKTYQTNSCDFELSFNGPASVEEYNEAAKREDAVLDDAVNNIIWRSTLPQWQRAFADALATRYPDHARIVDEAATAKAQTRAKDPSGVAPVMEKATKYIARVTAAVSDDLSALAQQVADAIVINPAPTVRAGGGGVNKGWIAKAQDIISRDEEIGRAHV